MAPPGPVKISHKKDGHRIRPHRFHVSRFLEVSLESKLRQVGKLLAVSGDHSHLNIVSDNAPGILSFTP